MSRQTKIRVVDLGGHRDFQTSAAFLESTVDALTARRRREGVPPLADVEVVRSRDRWIVQVALDQPTVVLHVLAHGVRTGGRAAFTDDDEQVAVHLDWLQEQFEHNRSGIEATVLFADACDTATPAFMKVVRDLIQQPTVYVGAKKRITWWQSTTFASAFYAAFFESTGHGVDPIERGRSAAGRAVRGYRTLVGGDCPYEVKTLRPSAWASNAYDTRW